MRPWGCWECGDVYSLQEPAPGPVGSFAVCQRCAGHVCQPAQVNQTPDGSHDDLSEDTPQVHTDGGVSAFTGQPFVTVHTDGDTSWQWSCEEARAFAVLLIRTADAAEADADLVDTLQAVDADDQVVAGLLVDVRARRAARP